MWLTSDYLQELLFNVDTGYLEALVRGFRSGILAQSDYLNLSQCETLEGNDRSHFYILSCSHFAVL